MQIAKMLTAEKALTVTAYHAKHKNWTMPDNLYQWCANTVSGILECRKYTGSCQIHYIREITLYKRVLECIQRTLTYGRVCRQDSDFPSKTGTACKYGKTGVISTTPVLPGIFIYFLMSPRLWRTVLLWYDHSNYQRDIGLGFTSDTNLRASRSSCSMIRLQASENSSSLFSHSNVLISFANPVYLA